MANALGTKPEWLTFDCYGTLIQWDEGLIATVQRILGKQPDATIDTRVLIEVFDRHEHGWRRKSPNVPFAPSLRRACGGP